MIDVDNFKDFNDRFGHIAGDRALTAVANLLKEHFRPNDILIRYGGDEFAVLLPGVDDEQALTIADRVRQRVSGDTGDTDDSLIQVPIRLSMGIAALGDARSLDSLIRKADAALYRAKRAGRNAVSV
jgi:diguanylate cyclase (GGDEF)-like protein